MTVNLAGIKVQKGQVRRSGIIVVAESEHRGMNTKREGTEGRRRSQKETATETGPTPRNHHLRINMRFVHTSAFCVL